MYIGKKVYYVPSLTEKPVRGTITSLFTNCGVTVITITTKENNTITDTENKFSIGYPYILKYWN